MIETLIRGFLKSFLFLIGLIDYIPEFFISNEERQYRLQKYSIHSKLTDENDPSSPYQSCYGKGLFQLNDENTNLFEEFERTAKKIPNTDLFGVREVFGVENEEQENGKIIKKFDMGEYKWQDYKSVHQRVMNFSNGLLSIGLKSNSNLVLFCETRPEWIISALACFRINVQVVTLYATLGLEGLKYGLLETSSEFLITSMDQLGKLENILDSIEWLKFIIVVNTPHCDYNFSSFKQKFSNKKIFLMEEVEDIGKQIDEALVEFKRPILNDVAIIMYTSGSTGSPKGALISHRNLLTSMKIYPTLVEKGRKETDTYIGYLPLAHILELNTELSCIVEGIRIGYSSPFTLVDSSLSIKPGQLGDMRTLKPTFMVSVPLVLERICKAVNDKVNKSNLLRKNLFKLAFNQKLKAYQQNRQTFLLDKLIFNKIKIALSGGQLRLVFCGGALLNEQVQKFSQVCVAPIRQAYALTETCAGGTVQQPFETETMVVGSMMQHCLVRLIDWEEGNYHCTDKPNPRGEIHIGGDSVALGYYKMPEKTQEDFYYLNGIRYFATGDIGEMLPNGTLKIIDRKKDLIKLHGGEYVSLNKVETCIKILQLVENCCVYAHPLYSYCICLICPNVANLSEYCKKHNIPDADNFNLIQENKDLSKLIAGDILKHCLGQGLNRFEIPQKIKLVKEIWLPESGLVTDSMKLKRKTIEQFYQKYIQELYSA